MLRSVDALYDLNFGIPINGYYKGEDKMLVTGKEILSVAKEQGFAVPRF